MEKTLQDICREAKEYQHLTTQDLADLTDLSSSTISNYFSASSKDPSLYKMGLICAAVCTQVRPKTSTSITQVSSSSGSPTARIVSVARHGAIVDSFLRILLC